MRALYCAVSGKVQGVWYRDWTMKKAKALGIKGYVRNMRDGGVEVMAQGPDEILEQFKEALREGSPISRVDDVRCEWKNISVTFRTFDIKY